MNTKENNEKRYVENEQKETHKLEEEKNTYGNTKGYSERAKTKELNKQSKTGDKMQNSSWENYNRRDIY